MSGEAEPPVEKTEVLVPLSEVVPRSIPLSPIIVQSSPKSVSFTVTFKEKYLNSLKRAVDREEVVQGDYRAAKQSFTVESAGEEVIVILPRVVPSDEYYYGLRYKKGDRKSFTSFTGSVEDDPSFTDGAVCPIVEERIPELREADIDVCFVF